jgi:hypothetical protein
LFALGVTDVGYHHFAAFGCEPTSNRFTKPLAAACACDEGDLTLEFSVLSHFSLFILYLYRELLVG